MPKLPPFRAHYDRIACHLTDAQVWQFLIRLFTMLQITSCTLEDVHNEIHGTPLGKHADAILRVMGEADDAIAELQFYLDGRDPTAITPGTGAPPPAEEAEQTARATLDKFGPDARTVADAEIETLPPPPADAADQAPRPLQSPGDAPMVPFFALQAIIDQARDPSTPPAVLIDMAEDPHPTVRLVVAQNPATPLDTLRRLKEHDTHAAVREAAGQTHRRKVYDTLGQVLRAGPAPAHTEGAFLQMRGRWWHPLARWLGFAPKPVCVWKNDPKAIAVLMDAWNKTHGPWPPPKS